MKYCCVFPILSVERKHEEAGKGMVTKSLAVALTLYLGLLAQAEAVSFRDDKGNTFSAGGDLRWRYAVTENILDLDDDVGVYTDTAKYYRNRIRLWTKFGIAENISATIRIVAEPWWGSYLKNDTSNRWPLEFDNAFLEVKDAFVKGLHVKLGRQDIIYGDTGFMILDGTPADGSRTIFHDGIKLSYALQERTTIDLFGAILEERDYGRDDDWDIQGLYLTSRDVFGAFPEHKLELYVLRSHQGLDIVPPRPDPVAALQAQVAALTARLEALQPPTTAAPANDDADISDNNIIAPGMRLSGSFEDELITYAAEATLQTGGTNAVSREGLGYYAQVTLNPGAKINAIRKYAPKLRGGYYFLSGDDPATAETNEGLFHFTNLTPRYGVVYMYTLLAPPVVSKWGEPEWLSNMTLAEGLLSFKPARMLVLTARLGLLGAEFARAGEGTHRGTLVHVRADYALTQNITGRLLGEWFMPGDYYTVNGIDADTASFFRAMTYVRF